jgi:hypothetical protein
MGLAATEFLLANMLALALIMAVAIQLGHGISAARAKSYDFRAAGQAESTVRAVETALNSGAQVGMWPGGRVEDDSASRMQWRVEGGFLRVSHRGMVLEYRGVFSNDTSEPV